MRKLSIVAVIFGILFAATSAHAGKDGWLKNYDEALKMAQKEGKIILVEFHGSDWCPPCIQLEKQVLSKDEFKAVADAALVLVDADFPRKTKLSDEQKAHNEMLSKQFGVQYFPTVLLLNSQGEVLDKMVGFPRNGLEGFIKFITDQISKS